MGPFRRQLMILLMTASPAMAGVCETVRPGWVPSDGAASALTEVMHFLLWGGGAVPIVGLALGLYFRKSIILNAVLLVTLIMSVPYIWPLDATTRTLAMAEGCIGQPTLVIAALGVIWVAALAGVLIGKKAA